MKKLYLMFNHTLQPEQKAWADDHFGPCRVIEMPDHLKASWGQIPSDCETLFSRLAPFRDWLDQYGKANDLVLIQGDFGATYLMVAHAVEKGLVPVYATTERKALETRMPDGTVKMEHQFRFCRFRKYGE
ncbi:CRISPR-associated protein Csx20 [Desulfobacter latus]|uniref:CRISPR-associated protein n=1 Tax=Desulfobacter latus TaxID=2292 RepID=A0A850T6A6_9BACT|nr:CRISPR-associated protein Csx20 [Desulfobacter latus]NWH03868.1 hypothetical protein [Desulfobacter latus]